RTRRAASDRGSPHRSCASAPRPGAAKVAAKYSNFADLSRSEKPGIDFGIRLRQAGVTFAIVAPHGGGIEPGTSEIADAVAAEAFSFYAVEGLKTSTNGD